MLVQRSETKDVNHRENKEMEREAARKSGGEKSVSPPGIGI